MRILQKSAWLLCAAMLSFGTQKAMAQAKTFAAGNLTYTENFDGMGAAGADLPTGWVAIKSNDNSAITTLGITNGGASGGNVYNVGTTGSTERALGTLASGSSTPFFGASFVNNTGAPIGTVDLAGVMEQWRSSSSSAVNETVVFEYSIGATGITNASGTWTAVPAMDLVEKLTSANTTAAPVDGNHPDNKTTTLSASITGLAWGNGQTLWIRWKDADVTGSDGLYAIDDFRMDVTLAAACTPTKLAITSVTPTSPVQNQLFNVTVQAQSAGSTACSIGADALVTLSGTGIGGTTTGTIVGGTSSITISGVTLSQAGSITVTAAGGSLTDGTTSITVQEAANQLIFGTVPTSGFVGTNITSFSVRAARTDATTDATYTGSITLAKASGPGTISGTLTKTASAGFVNFNDIKFSAAGTYRLSVTGTSIAGSTVSTTDIVIAVQPTFTELVVPQYIGATNVITPIAMAFSASNLAPNTSYDVRLGLDTIASAATNYGAGSIWSGSAFGASNPANVFTTDASGNSGVFWIYLRSSSNARFAAGKTLNVRLSVYANGSTAPTNPMFVGSKQVKTLDLASTAATGAITADDGAYVRVTNLLTDYAGKYVLIYDNTTGTGNPMSSYQCVTATPANGSQGSLPTSISDIWQPAASAKAGDFAGIVPITLNNPNGVRRIEVRNANNTIAYVLTDADGIWYGSGNTISLARRDVATITASCTNPTPTATVVGASVIKIEWTAGGYSAYEVQWKPTAGSTWNTSGVLYNTANSYRAFGLTPSTSYDLRVRMRCTSGETNTSWETVNATTAAVPLCTPLVPSLGVVGKTIIQITWPSYTANTIAYEVRWRKQGTMTWSNYFSTYFLSTTSHRIFGLDASTTYEWQVRNLCNPSEWNDWSAVATATTLAETSCTSFTGLNTDIVGATAARVVWNSYTTNTATYELRWRVKNTSTWSSYLATYFSGDASRRIFGLTPSTTYEWQLRNLCTPSEWNDWSAVAEFTTAASPTCAPLSATATVLSSTTAKIAWPMLTNNTYLYDLRWRAQGSPTWITYTAPYFTVDTVRRITGLTASTTYEWEIRTLCAPSEWNAWSATSTFTTLGAGRVGAEALPINVYPNPSRGIVNVLGVAKGTYLVLNTLGQIVASGELTNEATTLDLSNQASGMYLLKVVSNGAVQTKQISINR